MDKKKILIMYARYGTGHKAIANYVKDYFTKNSDYEIKLIDILDYNTRIVGNMASKVFNNLLVKVPSLWDVIYYSTDNRIGGKVGAGFQSRTLNKEKLSKTIMSYNPDLIISTHFTATNFICRLKKQELLSCPLVCIVTDHKAHQMWLELNKYIDKMIVSATEIKRVLIKKGIPSYKIKTYGIPISDKYIKELYDKSELLKKYKVVGDKPIILFYAGGGDGSFASIPYLLTIIELRVDADVFFVCGKNKKLKEKAQGMVKRHGAKNIRVLGFIETGPEYLAISDFVITRPGGITTSEALCFNKPMVLIKGVGGQEKDNNKFLQKKGYAVNARWLFVFRYVLNNLCSNPKALSAFQSRVNKANQNHAMEKLFNLVNSMLK